MFSLKEKLEIAERNLLESKRRGRFKRKAVQTSIENSLGVSQLLICKDDLEIYFHRFEEFFKTLKFHIKQKSDFYVSIDFVFPKKDLLLEIKKNPLQNKTSLFLRSEDSTMKDKSRDGNLFQSINTSSEKDSFYLEAYSTDFDTMISPKSLAHSPICKYFADIY